MSLPLQNRVTPFGEIVALPAKGTMMGNRGGRLHDDHKRLRKRRWASKAWICCELSFKGWHREVMAPRNTYTELFFLDEVTALAAGHRPCFECRRSEAKAFQAAFPGEERTAVAIDILLQAERLGDKPVVVASSLPPGAVWADSGHAYAYRGRRVLCWSPDGWQAAPGWRDKSVQLLTPTAIVTVLRNGYEPRWHASAGGGLEA